MKTLKLIKNDPWLAPYKQAIEGRHNRAVEKISEITGGTPFRFCRRLSLLRIT